MRENIKKGFKANYGLIEAKKKMSIYDELTNILSNDFEGSEQEKVVIVLNDEKIDMLHSFINWYVSEIEASADLENVNIDKTEHIMGLKRIRNNINKFYEK